MILDDKPYTFDRTVRILFSIAFIIGAIWLLGYLKGVLIPFIIATLLAYMLNPTVEFINRWVKNHNFSIFLTLLIYVSMITGLLWLVLPLVFQQFVEMGELLTGLIKNSNMAEEAQKRLPDKIWIMIKEFIIQTDLTTLFQTDNFWKITQEVSTRLIPVLSGTANFLIGLLGLAIIILYLIFIMRDFQKFRYGWHELIPEKYRDGVVSFAGDFNSGMKRYFRGQALIASIV